MKSSGCGKCSRSAFVAVLVAVAAVCGCRQNAEQALDKVLKQTDKQKEPVFPLAGRVMIDGQPPVRDQKNAVVVILIAQEKVSGSARGKAFVECDRDGKFAFSTYALHDGIPPGNYVFAIAKLQPIGARNYLGPDQLHNLYNDPENKSRNPDFTIDHKAPGKTDYEFDLKVAGVEPATEPGPKAITSLGRARPPAK